MNTKPPHTRRRIVAGLCGFLALKPSHLTHSHNRNCHPERRRRSCCRSRRTCGFFLGHIVLEFALALTTPLLIAQTTGPQSLVFTGLLGSTNAATPNAQFNAVQSDASGNLYLLLDQKDGVRLLKTDSTATNVLAQTQLGAAGDIGLALTLDPSGNIYIAGTTSSGTIIATSGAAFPGPTDTSTNAFIGKFDQNLNPLFITYAGSGHLSVAGLSATADAVFLTGSIFAATLPVTPSAIIQSPAFNTLQNGFVERFNSTGTALIYATYLSGQNGNTAPAAITADASGNAYIAGYTTSSGYPTLAALIPDILSPTSGFLTKLTPAGDGLLFSTFIPGPGITSIAIDPAAQNLLLSGSIALGQFPIATVFTPLVNTTYQSLLRLPLDGSTVLASTLLAPGTQSTLTPAPNQSAWVTSTLTTPSWLLPLTPLSTLGNSYALRVTQQNQIDQTIRFGGLPTTNPNFASAPVTLTSVTSDPTGQPIFAGSASPTASSSLLATETYDLPLYNSPTPSLPSTLRAAILPPSTCNGSLCSGSAAYLAKLNATTAAPNLTLSTDATPNLTLRNLGSLTATNLQLTATNFTLAHNCPTTLAPGAECTIALTSTSTNPGTLTAQADNATTQSATLPATTTPPNPIAFSPKELDFGIVTSTSPAATRTITLTNLTRQPQTFTSQIGSNQLTPYIFSETSSDCPPTAISTYTVAPNATCHITLSLTASPNSTDDGFAQSNWIIGPGSVLLTAYTQAASLSLSATEIDFGTQFSISGNAGIQLPRYLYLSNNSSTPITHTPVTLTSPFTLTDNCPTTLEPHTLCQLQLTYQSPIAPSADSTTLTLDQSLTVLITGSTLPQSTGIGESVNPNLTVAPTAITFPTPVLVTSTSATTQSVTIGNTGTQPFALTLALTGDFTDTTDCPAILPGNSTCTALITFAPSQPGTRQGLLSVTAGTDTSPTFVNLTGTGTAITTTPNSTLAFGDVLLGQPSVQWTKITSPFSTLTAASSAPDFKTILVEDIGYGHGSPPTSAFTSTFTGPCTNCWLGVQFTPSTTIPQTATLTLTSTTSGTPAPFTLTGTGLPLIGLIITPPTQDFGPIPVHSTSAPILFTLTNLTSATVSLTTPTTTSGFNLADPTLYPTGGPACNGPLAPNASCFVNVIFMPTSSGPLTGTLTIGTVTAPLTGFGSPDPGLALNPTDLIFNNVPGPTSTQQNITLTNTSSANLQIAAPTAATSDFASATNCTTLTPAATCNITVTFTPTDALTTDTLQIPITSSLTGLTTYTVPLTGNYTTEDAGLQILPNQASYGPTPTTTLGPTRQFTINNLTAKSLTLDVALPRQFVLASPPCAALAPNASCQFSVTFLPLTNGDITGTLFAQVTPTDGSATINGLGYVEGYGIGASSLAITGNIIPSSSGTGNPLNFGQVSSGQSSQQTLTLTNNGAATLTIRRITSEWPFLVTTTTCGSTLAANQNCTVTLTYTPLNQIANGTTSPQSNTDTGTLVIESDSLTAPDFIELTGTAAPISIATPNNTAPLVSYTASQSSLTFATTQVGDAAQPQTVTLSNTGTVPIQITNLQTTPDFTIQTTQSNCTTILPSASCTLAVTFTPQPSATNSTRISALEITSDASTALDFISLFGTATPSPLVLAPISLDFGTVQLGGNSTLPLQITNTSAAPVTFNSITTTGDYAPTGNCPTPGNTLAPNTTCTEQITFTPTQTGTRTGSVALSTSLTSLPIAAPLTGIGIQSHLQITPSALSFGSIAIGASSNLTLTLSNTGTASVTNLALTITGDYAVTIPCTTTTLAPKATCTATITFTPTTLGPRTGSLTIASSDASSPTLVPLTGTGVANGSFLFTVNGSTSASATVGSEFPATYNLQLTPQNSYTGNVVLSCTPINPGQYATCSLLPSSITLNGAAQNAIATINTITSIKPAVITARNTIHPNLNRTLLCLLPAGLLFFWNTRIKTTRRKSRTVLWITLLTATILWPSGCGRGGDPNIHTTPPGTYQYQVTASSATGVQLTQTVTLNLTVTP